jgi:hypothetical protein
LRPHFYRVNFEVNHLKPFPHLAFPHFLIVQNAPKQPSFDGELMASCLANYFWRFRGFRIAGEMAILRRQSGSLAGTRLRIGRTAKYFDIDSLS